LAGALERNRRDIYQVEGNQDWQRPSLKNKVRPVVHGWEPEMILQKFYTTSNMHHDSILEISFLQQHQPSFDRDQKVVAWNNHKDNKQDKQELQHKKITETVGEWYSKWKNFFAEPKPLPSYTDYNCKINLLLEIISSEKKLRPFLTPEMEKLKVFIDEMLAKQHIRHSTSPYGSGIIMVLKQDWLTHVCVNYHQLNRLLPIDNFALPLIDDLLF
jgi:hypothetical protein